MTDDRDDSNDVVVSSTVSRTDDDADRDLVVGADEPCQTPAHVVYDVLDVLDELAPAHQALPQTLTKLVSCLAFLRENNADDPGREIERAITMLADAVETAETLGDLIDAAQSAIARHGQDQGWIDRRPGQEHALSPRETEVMALICQGLSNQQIAAHAFLSMNTVKTYIRSAYRKIEVTTRSQAVLWGLTHGLNPTSSRGTIPE